jgi:ATP adenylyltransferase
MTDNPQFNVTICPALGAKMAAAGAGPLHNKPKDETPRTPPPPPFKPPYVPGLYVGCLEGIEGEPTMSVLVSPYSLYPSRLLRASRHTADIQLNKFAVLPEHFRLCPVEDQPQNLPPTPAQLARVYSILQAGVKARRPLFAFYNGGPGAGASQPWRHVQFIDGPVPIEDWVRDVVFERDGTFYSQFLRTTESICYR